MTDALTKRKQLKSRKPTFLAQDTHKKKRIRQRWKRPRGLQSKIRLNKRGYRKGISSGWRSPKAARGLSPEGLVPVRVENLAQLEAIDAKTHGAIVSGRVSIRTKKLLYDEAKKRSITVLNRDAKVFEERYAARMSEREERKKSLEKKRKRQEKLKKEIEKTKESGVASSGLKDASSDQDSSEQQAPKQEASSEASASPKAKKAPEDQQETKASAPKTSAAESTPSKSSEKSEPKQGASSPSGSSAKGSEASEKTPEKKGSEKKPSEKDSEPKKEGSQ